MQTNTTSETVLETVEHMINDIGAQLDILQEFVKTHQQLDDRNSAALRQSGFRLLNANLPLDSLPQVLNFDGTSGIGDIVDKPTSIRS